MLKVLDGFIIKMNDEKKKKKKKDPENLGCYDYVNTRERDAQTKLSQ